MKNKFVLYSDNIEGIIEYKKGVKLEEPIKIKMSGVYKHSFGCSLNKALVQWACLVQIIKFERFYHSITKHYENGTKFNILMLPFVYLFATIDKRCFHKIKFVY